MNSPGFRRPRSRGDAVASACRSSAHRAPRASWLRRCAGAALAGTLQLATVQAQMVVDQPAAEPRDVDAFTLEDLVNVRVEFVYGASKYQQKVTQAPSSVSIVGADEIRAFGHRTLGDVLRATRGFYVSNDRNYSYLGARGFLRPGDYNTRFLVLVDGHRMNENVFDGGYVDADGSLDVDLIERVEVVRGPSSSIYGNNAFFGVLNVVTKRGRSIDGGEISAEAGSFGTYRGRFTYGKQFANEVEWLVSGTSYTSGGADELYYPEFDQRISTDPRARNDGIAADSDGEKYYQLFSSMAYRDLTLTGLYSSRTKDIPTASFGSFFGTQQEYTYDARSYVELKFLRELVNAGEVLALVSYDRYSYKGDYPYDWGTANDPAEVVINKDVAFGDWLTAEVQWKRRIFDRHTAILGAEFRENLRQEMLNYEEPMPDMPLVDDRRDSRTYAAYLQAETALQPELLLNAGLRFDHYSTFGSTLNPRVGLIYSPQQQSTFKLLYGQAFRAPNDYELHYGAAEVYQLPNPELHPEKIRTFELVFEHYLPANLRFGASAYHYDISNLISQTTLPDDPSTFYFDNIDRVRANGVELELEAKYASGLLARASYTLQRTEDVASGLELSSSPRHLGKLNVIVPLVRDRASAGIELQYHGRARTLLGNQTDDFVLVNCTLVSAEIVEGVELSASIYNAFDANHVYPGASDHLQDVIALNGRSFRLGLKYGF